MDEEELFKNLELAKKIVLIEDKELFQELAKDNIQQTETETSKFKNLTELKNIEIETNVEPHEVEELMTAEDSQQEIKPAEDTNRERCTYLGSTPEQNIVETPQEPMSTKQDKNEALLLAVKCSRCNNERKIYSQFLCKSCYNYLHLNKEKHKMNIERWKEKNPNYFRDYYRTIKSKTDWTKKEVEEIK